MSQPLPRPAAFGRQLLAAIAASDGRRRRRKRDTTPDAIGLDLKRRLLEALVRDDPDPEAFDAWLAARCTEPGSGGARAMARAILEEWRMAASSPAFRTWLRHGAPSDDAADAP